jgi:hypothetical protein
MLSHLPMTRCLPACPCLCVTVCVRVCVCASPGVFSRICPSACQVYTILDEYILSGEIQEVSQAAILERMHEIEKIMVRGSPCTVSPTPRKHESCSACGVSVGCLAPPPPATLCAFAPCVGLPCVQF